jgi:glutathione S-transferase
MEPVVTVFANSPDRGRGLARDMRVRWALEEAGIAYVVARRSFDELKTAAHRRINPFGQIPTYEAGDLSLFESGAIVLHIARASPVLLPLDPVAHDRAIAWVFAAVDTVEPPIFELAIADIVERQEPWHEKRRPMLLARVRQRLGELAAWLDGRTWLETDFTAGDLMMVTVLRRVPPQLLEEFPSVARYVARGEARPAFARAFAAQRDAGSASGPPSREAHGLRRDS